MGNACRPAHWLMGMDGGAKPAKLQHAAATVSPDAVEEARYGLARGQPHRSARRVFYFTQMLAIVAVVWGVVWAAQHAPAITFGALHVSAFLIFSAAILVRLFAAASLSPVLFRLAAPAHFPTYTILCPLYREANIVPDLVAALARLDYPGTE